MSEFFDHEMTQTMFRNNIAFYRETESVNYDIFYFARKMLRGRWNGESVIRFLAFGARGDYPHFQILKTLDEEFPTWRNEFA